MKNKRIAELFLLLMAIAAIALLVSGCGSPEEMGRQVGEGVESFTEDFLTGLQQGCCGSSAILLCGTSLILNRVRKS